MLPFSNVFNELSYFLHFVNFFNNHPYSTCKYKVYKNIHCKLLECGGEEEWEQKTNLTQTFLLNLNPLK